MSKKIYVVDDEQNIRDIICSYLKKEGFETKEFVDGESLLEEIKNGDFPDMFIIDIMMPGISGFELCNEIRKKDNTPIIIVSARDEELDRILGIEMGADDYLMKPFSPRELLARVNAIFRRVDGPSKNDKPSLPVCKDIKIYPDERRIVKISGDTETEIAFTAMEFNFITFMVTNKNKVFNRDQLLQQIWGYQYTGDDTRAVDDLVKRIRKKLDAANTEFAIETVWGYGYKVTDQSIAKE
ncbi:MAG: response regulator transcription factor [Clostridiales bacterium]|nr:response regulator transcription factor [Clostridiales bacterium]